jgi:hypothetical protein
MPAQPLAAATGMRPAACKAVCSLGRGRPPLRRRVLPCSTGRAATALPADADYPAAHDVLARPPAAATGLRPAACKRPTRRGEDGLHCGDTRGILAAIEDPVRGRCTGIFPNRYFDLWVTD